MDRSLPAHLDRIDLPEDKIRRLTRRPPEAKPAAAEAVGPQSKAREDRKPEAEPSARPPVAPAEAKSKPAMSAKSLRRPLLFALLPLVLIVAGYFYVTGGDSAGAAAAPRGSAVRGRPRHGDGMSRLPP